MLPGINIGDIGKKMGRDGIDNGYIQVSSLSLTARRLVAESQFTYVRVPRAHMLMKHTQVARDGTVTEPVSDHYRGDGHS